MQRNDTKILSDIIKFNSATPEGFSCTDALPYSTVKAAHQRCRRLMDEGAIFKARVTWQLIRYFDTQEAATEFVKTHAAIEAAKSAGASIGHAPKASRFTDHTFSNPVGKTLARVKNVEIIFPPGYKHTITPMAPPRNTTVEFPFIHGTMRAMPAGEKP
jgi:hypothetical protein